MNGKYKTTVTQVGGSVFISLPEDQYIEMTPAQARAIAGRLFRLAAKAEGNEPPSLVVFTPKEDE